MQTHYLMLGVFAATTLGVGYLMTGRPVALPAIAQEIMAEPAAGFDMSSLLRIDEGDYQVVSDASVDLNAETTVTIRKIEYGRESEVTVVRTATGTYSSDALVSPYVLYPGVTVSERSPRAAAARGKSAHWSMPVGPAILTSPGSPSFIQIAPIPGGGQAIITNQFKCVVQGSTVVCV